MWTFGKSEWIPEDLSPDAPFEPKNTYFGECDTFPEAMDLLFEHVENLLKKAERSEAYKLEVVLAEMRVVRDDPGIRYDPDMWEEQEFYGEDNHISYFVAE